MPAKKFATVGQVSSESLPLEDLQTELLRLEGRISNRLTQAFEDLEHVENFELRNTSISRHLAYASATLDIAIAPNPELNLFDMISFLEITRSTLVRHWIPATFGEKGQPILGVFETSIPEAWDIAKKVLSLEQQEDLSHFISQWIERHPQHTSVETLRFSRFPEAMRGDLAESDPGVVRRLIQHANKALEVADSSRLLAERAFYYVQRAPFILRLQARVAARELVDEVSYGLRSRLSAQKGSLITAGSVLALLTGTRRLFRGKRQ